MSEWLTRIVIVHAEGAARSLMGEMLRREGFHVALAANGEEGLAACYRFRPRIVLLDATLPEESGFRLARMIKSAPEFEYADSPVAILLLTGRRLGPDQEHTLKQFYRADAVLYTPFEKDAVVNVVRQILSQQREQSLEADLLRKEQEIPEVR